jgi:hypothetical protein
MRRPAKGISLRRAALRHHARGRERPAAAMSSHHGHDHSSRRSPCTSSSSPKPIAHQIRFRLAEMLKSHFHVDHITLQVEHEPDPLLHLQGSQGP